MLIEKHIIAQWRQSLKEKQAVLATFFTKTNNSRLLLAKLSDAIDTLLKEVWLEYKVDANASLIAVGGYGRQELFPYSDIDLLILLPDHLDDAEHRKIEALVGTLWDIGLNVGHSVRNLGECISEANHDVTVQTNLLEARLITGADNLFKQLQNAIQTHLNTQDFLDKKIQEQSARHAKFNDTAYSLEPNLKESPGGLRDLNMIIWLAKSQGLGGSWESLKEHHIINDKELGQIKRHELYLQNLRIRLHYLAKRREDRLIFDFQNDLANQLSLTNTPQKRASEQLMQKYYRSVKYISLMNEILLKVFQMRIQSTPQETYAINERFSVCNGLLVTNIARLFQAVPSAIFECFLLSQQHPEIKGFSADLIRELQRIKKSINQEFRFNKIHKLLFLKVLSQPEKVNRTLRSMNRYGILGQYIPAFGKIIGQMQHDLFHVYTVDEHILNVLGNLRRFAKPKLAHEFPLCSQLFNTFDKPHLLYLAALFHDIAKGRGGDHSELGTLDARRFCKLHGLPKEDTELVAWLVEAHLKMSSTAQKSDLSDPDVIQQFAKLIKNQYRLTALYLLTVADIRGTSPVVWNAWKARLLENLFHLTQQALQDQSRDTLTQISLRKEEAFKKLKSFSIEASSVTHLWSSFGEHYFVRFDGDEIAWQSRLLMPHEHTNTPIVRARLSPKGDGIQVMIYSKDQHEIFARICQFFDKMHYNIAQAKIFTTKHGYALDNFLLLEQPTKQISYSGLLKHIEHELTLQLIESPAIEKPIQGRVNRQVKHMPIKTKVKIVAEPNTTFHQLEIVANDRPGLLAQVAQHFLNHQVEIHNAKINTLGNRVEDYFLISAQNGKALTARELLDIETIFSNL